MDNSETAQFDIPKDGVTMESICAFTQFRDGVHGEKLIKRQKRYPVHIKGAYSNGTVSFFIREKDIGISVRIDHLLQFLTAAKAAAEKALEQPE
jgi:hypothetical protein